MRSIKNKTTCLQRVSSMPPVLLQVFGSVLAKRGCARQIVQDRPKHQSVCVSGMGYERFGFNRGHVSAGKQVCVALGASGKHKAINKLFNNHMVIYVVGGCCCGMLVYASFALVAMPLLSVERLTVVASCPNSDPNPTPFCSTHALVDRRTEREQRKQKLCGGQPQPSSRATSRTDQQGDSVFSTGVNNN